MKISATVQNSESHHAVTLATDGREKTLVIEPKSNGRGSAVNGGELLMAALATCMCNDLFREAGRLGITIRDVEVEARGEFPAVGAAGEGIRYRVKISGDADDAALRDLVQHTDTVAEIQNTVRNAIAVRLGEIIVE